MIFREVRQFSADFRPFSSLSPNSEQTHLVMGCSSSVRSYPHWFWAFKSGKIGNSRILEYPDEDESFQRIADRRDSESGLSPERIVQQRKVARAGACLDLLLEF